MLIDQFLKTATKVYFPMSLLAFHQINCERMFCSFQVKFIAPNEMDFISPKRLENSY